LLSIVVVVNNGFLAISVLPEEPMWKMLSTR
jgi:hypothetical protein